MCAEGTRDMHVILAEITMMGAYNQYWKEGNSLGTVRTQCFLSLKEWVQPAGGVGSFPTPIQSLRQALWLPASLR